MFKDEPKFSQGAFEKIAGVRRYPDNRTERKEYLQFIYRALNCLSPKHRELMELYFLEGMPLQEIAQMLQISKSTASRRLCCAIRQLRTLAVLFEQESRKRYDL